MGMLVGCRGASGYVEAVRGFVVFGFLVCWFLGFKVSWFLSSKVH